MTARNYPRLDPTRYRLDERIGGGRMADVYAGSHLVLNRAVAVKVMHAHLLHLNSAFVQRFLQNEAVIAGNLHHPHIVETIDAGLTQDATPLPYLTMERLNGETLSARLRCEKTIPADEAVTITLALLDALTYANETLGVVHRDIKPSNVFLCKDGGVKLMDFGIALAIRGQGDNERLTNYGEQVGTFAYMPPELVKGVDPNAAPDPRSDLYSVGITLYEMLVGKPPFPYDTPATAAYHQMHTAVPPLPSSVPAPVRQVVYRALEKKPGDRFRDARTMRAALDCSARVIDRVRLPKPKFVAAGGASVCLAIVALFFALRPLPGGRGKTSPPNAVTTPVAPAIASDVRAERANEAARRAEELLNKISIRMDELNSEPADQRTPQEAARARAELQQWATEALENANTVIANAPEQAKGYFQKAYALYRLERYDEAYQTAVNVPKSVADDSNLKIIILKIKQIKAKKYLNPPS